MQENHWSFAKSRKLIYIYIFDSRTRTTVKILTIVSSYVQKLDNRMSRFGMLPRRHACKRLCAVVVCCGFARDKHKKTNPFSFVLKTTATYITCNI